MRKILILIWVGIVPILNSQTIFKDTYLLGQAVVNSYRFATPGIDIDSLIAYYPFDGNANDESGNNLDGTEVGAVTYVTDKDGIDSAIYLDGQNSIYVSISGDPLLNIEGALTINFWIYRIFGSNNDLVLDYNANGYQFRTVLSSDNAIFYVGGQSLTGGVDYCPTGEWAMITLYHNGSINRMYKNAVATTGDQTYTGTYSYSGNLLLGINQTFAPSLGTEFYMDKLRIYSKALTQTEITALYNE